ncbi:MAG: DUF3341 domain-containing protein [Luteibaculaceae bacterium]
MSKKFIYAMYDDEEILLKGAKSLVGKGIKINDVYSPFPIHGIDPVIGIKQTRLAIVSFMFGVFGLTLAIIGIRYFMIIDWPMNIGGKPSFSFIENVPSFVPVMFEFTVLCAAHGMALTYLIRNKTLPFMPATNPDPRTTDDKFVIELTAEDNSGFSDEELREMLKETGIIELNERQKA